PGYSGARMRLSRFRLGGAVSRVPSSRNGANRIRPAPAPPCPAAALDAQSTLRYKVRVAAQTNDSDADAALTPEQSLALIEGQTRGVKRAFGAQVPIYYFVWGGAWLLGYLLLWTAWEG